MLSVINRLKEITEKDNIQIAYGSLPQNENMLYIERHDVKLIIIDKGIKGTREEIKAISLGLGYSRAMKELDIKVNVLNEDDKGEYEVVTRLAEDYQKEILHKMNMQFINKLIKGKTQEEVTQLINDVVNEMLKDPGRWFKR